MMATVIVNLVEGEILDGHGELGVGVRREVWRMYLQDISDDSELVGKGRMGGVKEGEMWKEVAYAYHTVAKASHFR